MKKQLLVLILLCCFLFSGCGKEASVLVEYPLVGDTYAISKEGENVYLEVLSEMTGREPEVAELSFSSLNEMYTKIATLQLEHWELYVIDTHWPDDENGRALICDLNSLYEPQTPSKKVKEKLAWWGQKYVILLHDADGVATEFRFSPHDFEKLVQFDVKEYEAGAYGEGKPIKDRNAREYNNGTTRVVRYTLTGFKKIMHVTEQYHAEDTVPYQIDLLVKDDGVPFKVQITNFTERPSEEWLLSIGVTPFVPEEESPAA